MAESLYCVLEQDTLYSLLSTGSTQEDMISIQHDCKIFDQDI